MSAREPSETVQAAEKSSWIDRNIWKRRVDGVRFYKETSIADAIDYLQKAQAQEAENLNLGVILSLTLYEPKNRESGQRVRGDYVGPSADQQRRLDAQRASRRSASST